jgi:putative SOS response-associated peptidase YedK
MCYSAQVRAEYAAYVRRFGAQLSIEDYYELFWRRAREAYMCEIPKAMEDAFANPMSEREREIKALIDEFRAAQANRFEETLFEQKTRLVEAQRKLEVKVTKAAQESQRIATKKIEWARGKLTDLRRTDSRRADSRIFPDWYAPVMVLEQGRRVIKPMRYHCLPAGRPAFFDRKYPGTFNARRDSLETYWKGVFGVTHGVVLAEGFYEHVMKHKAEGRDLAPGEEEQDVVIEFRPQDLGEMLVACLWSRWSAPGQPDLLSFAAITDEPPPEVAAAGHDRCIIPLRSQNLDAWLNPDPGNLDASYAVLDDRERPYYEHRLAA